MGNTKENMAVNVDSHSFKAGWQILEESMCYNAGLGGKGIGVPVMRTDFCEV